MYYGMYVAAAGANAQSQRMDVISNNIANVGTTAFKRQLGIMQSRASEAIERGLDYNGSGTNNDLGGGVNFQESATDFRLGPLRQTGEDTDFALERPEAFFVVQKDGREFLTRAGNFHFDPQGTLITDQGYPVLGAGGGPIQIDPAIPFTVSNRGELTQAGEAKPLALRRPASLGDLVQAGENLYRSIGDDPEPVPDGERSVRWRHLEMSAVQPQEEMVAMIETSRVYEANVRMIQNHDSMLGSLLGRVLRSS